MTRSRFLSLCVILLAASTVWAERIYLANGDVLTGEIVEATDSTVLRWVGYAPGSAGVLGVLIGSISGAVAISTNNAASAEAMQRAVVATSVGGNRESVRHGESGLLVPAKDPAALAQAIEELLGQPARCAEMGRRGRRIVEERFSARAMVREMEALYDKLAAARNE